MTLLQLCEPLFLKICELNRMARQGESPNYAEVRDEIKTLLGDIQRNAGLELADQAKQLELPLTFFVDYMISSSKLKIAQEWSENRLAWEKHNNKTGDDEFFQHLQKTLDDTSQAASERLAVFYVCLGLGFVGGMVGQEEELNRLMGQMTPRIKHLMDVDTSARLCSAAYEHVDTRSLIEPPSNPLGFVLVAFLFLFLSTMVACVGMYVTATSSLENAIENILEESTDK